MIASTPTCDTSNWFNFVCSAIQTHDQSGLVGPLVQHLLSAISIFIVIYLIGRLTRMLVLWTMRRGKADRQVRTLVRNLITVTTYVVAVISALVVYGVNVAVILTAAGVGTVAIGLAFQDLLRNVLAGIWLLLEQPFRLGDTITVMDQTGAVQNITLRTTTLRTGIGELAILPNLTVFTGIVINTTHYDTRRLTVGVRIRVDTDLTELMRRAREAVETVPGIEAQAVDRLRTHARPRSAVAAVPFLGRSARAGSRRSDSRSGRETVGGCRGRSRPRSARAGQRKLGSQKVDGESVNTSQQIVVVRHGETEWSRIQRHTGRSDLPLTAEGRKQAESLITALAGLQFAEVFVSPLLRARQTCEIAGFADRAVIEPDLIEWDYGVYEGLDEHGDPGDAPRLDSLPRRRHRRRDDRRRRCARLARHHSRSGDRRKRAAVRTRPPAANHHGAVARISRSSRAAPATRNCVTVDARLRARVDRAAQLERPARSLIGLRRCGAL